MIAVADDVTPSLRNQADVRCAWDARGAEAGDGVAPKAGKAMVELMSGAITEAKDGGDWLGIGTGMVGGRRRSDETADPIGPYRFM